MDIINHLKSYPVRTFVKDEVLIQSGELNDTLYAIREGFIKVTALDEAGRQKLLWIAGRYDIVPVEQLFSKRPVSFFYSGLSDGSAYVINKTKLFERLDDFPEAMGQIARGLSEHYDDLLMRLNAVEQSDIRSKLLLAMHNLCIKFSTQDIVPFHEMGLNLTHQDLADMIGSTREAVSIEMSKLRDENIVEYSRSTFLVNRASIEANIETPA